MSQETIDKLLDIIKTIENTNKKLEKLCKEAINADPEFNRGFIAGRQSVITLVRSYIPTEIEESWMDIDE